jgi:hypothetical protein
MKFDARLRLAAICLFVSPFIGTLWADAQTPPPLTQAIVPPAFPVVIGPRALGDEAVYHVVSSHKTSAGTESTQQVWRIKWKLQKLFTTSLADVGHPAPVSEYIVPRGSDGSFAIGQVTPNDEALQNLCVPLETFSELFNVIAANKRVPGPWSSTMTIGVGASPPQAACGSDAARFVSVPVTATRTVAADGSAVLVASGTASQSQKQSPQRQRSAVAPSGIASIPGIDGSGGGYPRRRRPGAMGTSAPESSEDVTSSVSLTARFARDGTLLAVQVTKAVTIQSHSQATTVSRSVSIDKQN